MNAVPPKIPPAPPRPDARLEGDRSDAELVGNTTNSRLVAVLLMLAALGGAVVIFWFNPATHSFYPVCQFHQLTGLNCPGCGMTRAVSALLHGQWAVALRDNLLLVLGLGGLAVRGVWFGCQRRRGQDPGEFFPVKFLWLVLAAAVLFTTLRNLPGFAFLSPWP